MKRMKKLLSIVAALALVLSGIPDTGPLEGIFGPGTVKAADQTWTDSGITYTLRDDGRFVISGTGAIIGFSFWSPL